MACTLVCLYVCVFVCERWREKRDQIDRRGPLACHASCSSAYVRVLDFLADKPRLVEGTRHSYVRVY